MDVYGKIIDWNLRAEKMFGWTREEAMDRDLAETIIPHNLRDAHRVGLKHYLATGEGKVFSKLIEIVGLHREGREFPVELSISRVKTNECNICGWINI